MSLFLPSVPLILPSFEAVVNEQQLISQAISYLSSSSTLRWIPSGPDIVCMFLLLICSKSLPLAFPFERVRLTHVLQQRFLCGASVLLCNKRRHEEFIEVCCCGLTFTGPFTTLGPSIQAL